MFKNIKYMFKKIVSVTAILLIAMCSFMAVITPMNAYALPGCSVSAQVLAFWGTPYLINAYGHYLEAKVFKFNGTVIDFNTAGMTLNNGDILYIKLAWENGEPDGFKVFKLNKGGVYYTIKLDVNQTEGYWQIFWDPTANPCSSGPLYICPVSGTGGNLPPLTEHPADPPSLD